MVTTNLWAYAVQEKQRRRTQHRSARQLLAKQAELHGELACDVADLVDRLGDRARWLVLRVLQQGSPPQGGWRRYPRDVPVR